VDGLWVGAGHVPCAPLVIRVGRVIRLTHVRPIADRNIPLEIDGQQPAAEPQFQRAATERFGESDERLLNIEPILIDRTPHMLARRDRILELSKQLNVVLEPKIAVDLDSAEEPLSRARLIELPIA
jgi:hypothetical protein